MTEYLTAFAMALAYYAVKRTAWGACMYHHEGYGAYFRSLFGDNPFGYYSNMGLGQLTPLSNYFCSVLYGRSRKLGNIVYDAMVTLSGLNVFFIVKLVQPDPVLPLLTLFFFYVLYLTPLATVSVYNPEGVANFLATTGTLIAVAGFQQELPAVHFAGCLVAGLGFHVKVTTFDHLWPLVLAVFLDWGRGYAAANFIALALVYGSFAGLLLLQSSKGLASSLKEVLDFHAKNEAHRTNDFKFVTYTKRFIDNLHQHLRYMLPFVLLFGIYAVVAPGTDIKRAMLGLLLVSSLQMIVRFKFALQYGALICLPLAFGSAWCLTESIPHLATNPFAALATAAVMLIMPAKAMGDPELNPIYDWKRQTRKFRPFIIDYLKKKTSSEDYIFHNTHLTNIYVESGCKGPSPEFIWGNYLAELTMHKQHYREKFNQFFTECKPKYLIIAPVNPFHISRLENAYGLEYTLERSRGGFLIYKLTRSMQTHQSQEFDPRNLFEKDAARYEADLKSLRVKTDFLLKRGLERIAANQHLRALPYFRDAWEAMQPNQPETIKILSRCLVEAGEFDEATQVLQEAMLVFPESDLGTELSGLIGSYSTAGRLRGLFASSGKKLPIHKQPIQPRH